METTREMDSTRETETDGTSPMMMMMMMTESAGVTAASTASRVEEVDSQLVNLPENRNDNQSTTTRPIWAIRQGGQGLATAPTTTMTTTPTTIRRNGRRNARPRTNQMFCCYAFFLFLGFTCVAMGIGIMIDRLQNDQIGDILGYCILIIFGICLQLYAVFDIFKYVEAERALNHRMQSRPVGPDLVIFQQDREIIAGSGAPAVVDVVPTDQPPAYRSTTSREISSEVTIMHPVASLPLSTPPSYRTMSNTNNNNINAKEDNESSNNDDNNNLNNSQNNNNND